MKTFFLSAGLDLAGASALVAALPPSAKNELLVILTTALIHAGRYLLTKVKARRARRTPKHA